MPITQILLTATTAQGGGGTTPDGDFYLNNIPSAWGSVGLQPDNKPSYNSSYNFPDGTTSAPTWDFSGSNQFMTTGTINGVTELYLNMWFYPTAAGRVLMTIQGQLAENNGYHHTALEINANGTVSGRFWSNSYMTTDNAVTLNQWNHIYFRHTGSQALIQLNGGTATTANNSWTYPTPSLVLGFGTTSITNNGISARYQGLIADVFLASTNTASNYEDTRSKYETPPPEADFTIEWWQKMENNGNNSRAWSVGLYPIQKIAVSYEGGSSDFFWINDIAIGNVSRNHIGQGWQHMAMVRHNGVVKGYENGVNYFTSSNGNLPITATDVPLYVGTGEIAAGTFRGYIKDLHIIKGTAKYTGNFTPPIYPIQSQVGSVFLLPATDDGTKYNDTVGSKSSTLTGTVTWSSDTPFTALGPYSRLCNVGGVGFIDFGGANYNADLLNVKAGWTITGEFGGEGTITADAYEIVPGTIRIGINYTHTGVVTYTFTQPALGGSLYFNGSSYLNYGPSSDWAIDV